MPEAAEYGWEADLYDWEADLDADTTTSGGPPGRRRQNTPAQRSSQIMRNASRASMFPELAEPTADFDPLAAQNQGNADAGAIMLAAPEIALSGVAGGVGALADVATGDLNNRSQRWGDQVRTDVGRKGAGILGEAVAPAGEAVSGGYDKLFGTGPLAQTLKERGGQFVEAAGTVAGAGLGAQAARSAARTGAAARAPVNKAVREDARPYMRSPVADVAQRYTVLPDDAQHSAGLPTQGDITGSTRAALGPKVTRTEVPAANIRVATGRATQDLPGQLLDPNGRVDAGLLKGALEAESVPYQQVAQLPAPQVNTLAGRLREAWETRGGSLKGDAVAESRLLPLMDPAGPPLPTGELLRRWREINSYASDLRKASGEGSPAAQIKGQDLRGIAEAVLDEIDERAAAFAAPELVQQLKAARVNIARLHTLDDALDSVGWVDPAKLAAMADRHVPLTGGLAEVAADAAAAPRSLAPMKRAIDTQDAELDQFGRQPGSWLRNVAGHLGGNLLARRGVESLNRELRAGSGLLRQPVPETPVPPLAGPPAAPAPRLLPAPGPRGPMQGGAAGGPAPALPGEFEDMGYTPDVRAAGAQHPGVAPERAALTRSTVQPQPGSFNELLGREAPLQTDQNIRTLIGELGGASPTQGPFYEALNDFEMGGMERAMPARPRGVSGPRSAQLSDPRLPDDFALLDDTPPLQAQFGPADEFAFADALGPAPAEQVYRGVPVGADPNVPANDAGALFYSPLRSEAESYGPIIGEAAPTNTADLGTIADLLSSVGMDPTQAGQPGVLIEALRRYRAQPGASEWAKFSYPLEGNPSEFVRFPPRGGTQAPATPNVSDLLARYDNQDGNSFPWMSDDAFLRELADAEGVPPAAKTKANEYLERREADYRDDAGRGDSDEFAEEAIAAIRRLLGQ